MTGDSQGTRLDRTRRVQSEFCYHRKYGAAEWHFAPKSLWPASKPEDIMPETAAKYGLTNPHDPRAAIDAAARYLRDLLRRFDGRLDLAIAAYNAGEGTVDAFQKGRILRMENRRVVNEAKMITGGIPPYRETQNYVRSAIRLLTEDGLVMTKTSPASMNNNKNLTWIRDFTIDVSNLNGSASRSSEQVTPFFIDIP